MSKKTKIKTKVSAYGRNLSLSMTADRFAAIAKHLPEDSEERNAIEQMVAESYEIKARDELKSKLSQPLSKETLTRFGWDLGQGKGIITAGVRHGDFRLDSNELGEGWVFGPLGAFDRESQGRLVIKNAWQAGVFCEKHSAFLLEDPVQDENEARAKAQGLVEHWHKIVPKVIRPAPSRNDDTHEALPEGARRLTWGIRTTGTPLACAVRHGLDEAVFGIDNRRIDVLRFDACLRVDRYNVLNDLTWGLAAREYNPRWDTHKYVFDSPLDCILGDVWGAASSIYVMKDSHPHIEQSSAMKAAESFAVESGLIEGRQADFPDTLPVPDFARNAASDNPFA